MVVGIGTDLVEIARIARSLERWGQRFAARILAAPELEEFTQSRAPAAFLAKRFAAKEAASKALGTGMRQGVTFRQIIVEHYASGAPRLRLTARALEIARQQGANRAHISLSDERSHALAFVILAADPNGADAL